MLNSSMLLECLFSFKYRKNSFSMSLYHEMVLSLLPSARLLISKCVMSLVMVGEALVCFSSVAALILISPFYSGRNLFFLSIYANLIFRIKKRRNNLSMMLKLSRRSVLFISSATKTWFLFYC